MTKKQPIKTKELPVTPAKKALSTGQLWLVAGVIAVITYMIFTPAIHNSFINWDDNAYVFENNHLDKPLWESVQYFFGLHYFIGNYIPITMIGYALEYHAFGMESTPFHAVNILIHLINVVLVFWFIYLLSGKKTMVAALVALFFGIHPMHVESVAWVAELKDVLYSAFFLAGLICYYKYLEGRGAIANTNIEAGPEHKRKLLFPVLTLVFFILSVLCKPAAVIFPVMLLLLDFYVRRRFDKWVWLEKLPLFVVSVVMGFVTIKAQQADNLLHNTYPFFQRLLFACHSFLEYLLKLFLPIRLSIFYPYPKMVGGHLPMLYYIGPVIVALLCYGVYWTMKYTRLVAFGFLFFCAGIVLVLQLISVGEAMMAERYTYIPYIGLFFVMAMGVDYLYHSAAPKFTQYKPVVIIGVIVAALACGYNTYARCGVWIDDNTMADDLLEKYPDDALALNNKGFLLSLQKNYNESTSLLIQAVREKPDYTMAYINLINNYIRVNDMGNAMKYVDTALQHEPKNVNLLNTKGYLFLATNRSRDGIAILTEAVRLKPGNINGYVYLSECYLDLHDYDNAMSVTDSALKYDPTNFVLLNNKGYTLELKGKYREAITFFNASLNANPDYKTAQVNLQDCLKVLNAGTELRN